MAPAKRYSEQAHAESDQAYDSAAGGRRRGRIPAEGAHIAGQGVRESHAADELKLLVQETGPGHDPGWIGFKLFVRRGARLD